MGFREKGSFSTNLWPYYSMTIWRLWAKKLMNTVLTQFDFFPSKKQRFHCFFLQFCKSLLEKITKNKK